MTFIFYNSHPSGYTNFILYNDPMLTPEPIPLPRPSLLPTCFVLLLNVITMVLLCVLIFITTTSNFSNVFSVQMLTGCQNKSRTVQYLKGFKQIETMEIVMTAVALGAGLLGLVMLGGGRRTRAVRGVVLLGAVNLVALVSVFGHFVKMATAASEVSSCAGNSQGVDALAKLSQTEAFISGICLLFNFALVFAAYFRMQNTQQQYLESVRFSIELIADQEHLFTKNNRDQETKSMEANQELNRTKDQQQKLKWALSLKESGYASQQSLNQKLEGQMKPKISETKPQQRTYKIFGKNFLAKVPNPFASSEKRHESLVIDAKISMQHSLQTNSISQNPQPSVSLQ